MKTLFANNNVFAAFEILSVQQLNMVKGGFDKSRDADVPVELEEPAK